MATCVRIRALIGVVHMVYIRWDCSVSIYNYLFIEGGFSLDVICCCYESRTWIFYCSLPPSLQPCTLMISFRPVCISVYSQSNRFGVPLLFVCLSVCRTLIDSSMSRLNFLRFLIRTVCGELPLSLTSPHGA